jgi:hypothetical protein
MSKSRLKVVMVVNTFLNDEHPFCNIFNLRAAKQLSQIKDTGKIGRKAAIVSIRIRFITFLYFPTFIIGGVVKENQSREKYNINLGNIDVNTASYFTYHRNSARR